MNDTIIIDDENILEFRETPWDTRAFGFLTSEVLSIKYSNCTLLNELLSTYASTVKDQGVRFSYCRINAEDLELKKALQLAEYYYAETSILLTKRNVHKEDFGKIFNNHLTLTAPQSEEDYQQIKVIAQNAFHYSRFHEDHNIPHDRAKLRYFNWIDDLRLQNKEFVVLKSKNTVHAFLVFSMEEKYVNLIVGGSAEGKGFLSPFFWSSFLTEFQRRDIKRVDGIISAANIPIFNLYIKLGFKIDKVLLGFHRFFTAS